MSGVCVPLKVSVHQVLLSCKESQQEMTNTVSADVNNKLRLVFGQKSRTGFVNKHTIYLTLNWSLRGNR